MKHRVLMIFWVCLSGHTLSLAQGLILDDHTYEKSPRKVRLLRGDYRQLPDSASLKMYSPGPGNQLTYATSVGWALAWGARTILYARENNITDLKEIRKHVFSPGYIYELAKNEEDGDCSAGIMLEDGLQVLKNRGVPGINSFFTFCGGEISPEAETAAAGGKITDYARLFDISDPNDLKISSVKKSLAERLPVVIGMISPPSFGRAREFWQPTESVDRSHGGQALLVVGYNDKKYGGAFEVMNSHGRDWGNEGYLWIRYTDFVRFVKYGYELFVMPEEDHTLSGEMTLQLRSGSALSVQKEDKGYYKLKVALPSGAQFKITIHNDEPVFIYAFSSDLTKKCYKLFPFSDDISSALTYNKTHMAIPDEDHYIKLDNTPGTDYLCVLYTKEELDLGEIVRKVEESRHGDFRQRVHGVLGKSFNKEAEWADNRLSFNARISKGGVVAMFVEIQHN